MPAAKSPDPRVGSGRVLAEVVQATCTIPVHCLCTWVVVTPGPGLECLSALKYTNAMCPHRGRHQGRYEQAA